MRLLLGLAVLSVALLPAGCGSEATQSAAAATAEEARDPTTITVYAAASLRAPFTELAEDFAAEHPGWAVEFSFAGSSDLAAQIAEGAPADVFAAADEQSMARLGAAELADPAALFASNTMVIAVPPGNPADVDGVEDLASPEVAVVLCAPQVPCGAAAQQVQRRAGIDISPVSEESAVTDVLGKVTSGEADAGIVYVTDVETAGDRVEAVRIDAGVNAVNRYPIAALAGSDDPDVARSFVAFVLGRAGLTVLAGAGFGAP